MAEASRWGMPGHQAGLSAHGSRIRSATDGDLRLLGHIAHHAKTLRTPSTRAAALEPVRAGSFLGEARVNLPDIDPRLLDLLSRAGSLELFQLKSVIERMLADPKRIVQIRKDLHLGQTVHFLNARDGRIRAGKVLAMKDFQATIHDDVSRSSSTVHYAAILPSPAPQGPARPSAHAPAPPTPPRPGRNDFRCGDKVAFEDKHLNTVMGTIVRINQRTATIDPGDGTSWRVGFALLRHVVDI